MVKLDVRRDYYADLGLTPSADAEDIKKQFRKLALKYHPDRNPGREVESSAKFQAIQAAHEILIDPHQRLKYDTDRLRNGYFGPTKSSSARRDPTSSYGAAKPNTKAPFSERPKSFHHGPSTGAQRYASYARAAPKQPWEKMRDETQTRADAYRGFQEMKGSGMPGWSSFDPRTGRAGQPGAVPRPTGATNGSARPKSAYEHMYTGAKPTADEAVHAQSAKKKQGFAPRAAGGDEPMAANTASYRNASRFDRSGAAPSPTARKPAAGFPSGAENMSTPEYERTRSAYATTGGEKTFFSSSMLGRSGSARTSPKNPNPRPRTNPPSPDPKQNRRHRSASPGPGRRADAARNYESTSSSDFSEDEVMPKPKAVPKRRLGKKNRFANFHSSNGWFGTTHDSDSASSARNNSDTPTFYKKADFSFGLDGFPQNGTFKSSSHDDLRKSSHKKPFGYSQDPVSSNSRGRASTRDSPQGATGNTSKREPSYPESASQQQAPFSEETFLKNDWTAAFQFKNMSDALPTNDGSQRQPNFQRTRSPRKQTRPANRVRPTPQQASVTTEAEEAESTVEGGTGQAHDADGEAMDVDDETPAKTAGTAPAPQRPNSGKEKTTPSPAKPRPTSKSGTKDATSNILNLKTLSGVFPFTSTNSGGLEDLKDISSTLPFESRAKAPKTTMGDTHPRELACPNPPKRPEPPQPVLVSAGSKEMAIPRMALDRYIAEMNTYVREWEAFDGLIIVHFLSRHKSNQTEMAPNWLGAVGDSLRLGDEDGDRDSGAESDDDVGTTARRGFTSYKNALVQDEKVMKHWEVARERHLECMQKFGQIREWIRGGGKIL
ncbi:hypothetical protein BDW62DRAFT_160751 [Aspergillus aurantiobrunneus]